MGKDKPIQSEYPTAHIDLDAALSAFKNGLFKEMEVCIPACIYSYDATTHKANVLPLVKGGFFDGKEWSYEVKDVIKDVSVWQLNCGGISIDFPLHIGDTGWLIASDRNTEQLKQAGALTASVLEGNRSQNFIENEYAQEPANHGMHLLTNGFFIPDNWGRKENFRYKDSPTQSIANAIYIGTSFDTDEGGADKEDGEKQYGKNYERKPSSSLVITPHGPVSINGSSASEEQSGSGSSWTKKKQRGSSSVRVSESISSLSSMEEVVKGGDDDPRLVNREALVRADYADGVVIQHINPQTKQMGIVRASSDSISLTVQMGKEYAMLGMKGGHMYLTLSGNINIVADGDVTLKSEKNTNVVVNGDSNVNVGGTANISAVKGVNVASGGNVNINTAKTVSISSAEDVIVDSEKKVTVNAKKDATVKAQNINATAERDVKVTAGSDATISAPTVKLDCTSLHFLGFPISVNEETGEVSAQV